MPTTFCSIDLFGEFELNEFDDPVDNRITKLLSTIFICKGNLDDEVPPELVPRFLVLLQGGRINNNSEFDPFNTLFRFVRDGFMSLLNTRKYKVCVVVEAIKSVKKRSMI